MPLEYLANYVLRTRAMAPRTAASIMSIQVRSAGMLLPGRMGTVDVLLLFAGTGSRRARLTVAVFESVPAEATGGALIVNVIGFAAPTARVGSVHVTTPATLLQVQPVPVALTKVEPAGSVSLTDTFDACDGPRFETASV